MDATASSKMPKMRKATAGRTTASLGSVVTFGCPVARPAPGDAVALTPSADGRYAAHQNRTHVLLPPRPEARHKRWSARVRLVRRRQRPRAGAGLAVRRRPHERPASAVIAAELGISRRQAQNLLAEPDGAARLRRLQDQRLQALLDASLATAPRALETLRHAAENPLVPAAARISASRALLRGLLQLLEAVDTTTRIAELEQRVQDLLREE